MCVCVWESRSVTSESYYLQPVCFDHHRNEQSFKPQPPTLQCWSEGPRGSTISSSPNKSIPPTWCRIRAQPAPSRSRCNPPDVNKACKGVCEQFYQLCVPLCRWIVSLTVVSDFSSCSWTGLSAWKIFCLGSKGCESLNQWHTLSWPLILLCSENVSASFLIFSYLSRLNDSYKLI